MSSKVKVIGQRSRSSGWKTWFLLIPRWVDLCSFILSCHMTSCDIMVGHHYVMWRHSVTSLCHVTSQRDVMMSFDVFGQEYWQGGHDTGGPSTLRRFHFLWFFGCLDVYANEEKSKIFLGETRNYVDLQACDRESDKFGLFPIFCLARHLYAVLWSVWCIWSYQEFHYLPYPVFLFELTLPSFTPPNALTVYVLHKTR